MTKKSLVAIIEEQERYALSGGRLAEDRIEAMDAYLGRPYGDEEEGRSQIVMRDVADTVEWIKPSLMKVFCSGDEVVVFNPVSLEDEPQAEQETDYCNHVLMNKNPGFLILHDWFHDALLQKNGYVMVSAEMENRDQKDRYTGLTDDEFAMLASGEENQIIEHAEVLIADEFGGPPQVTHDAVVVCKREYACVKISNIPPERVLVSPDWPGVSLEGCPFVEVIDWKTISELRQDGYDVDDEIDDTTNSDDEFADENRRVTLDTVDSPEDLGADKATRRLKVRYVWLTYDPDNSGKAEIHKIVIVGSTILEDEEDTLIPVACAVPYRMPHEHNGLSVFDYVQDIQRIRTALIRGFLDNMYLVNNPRHAIDAGLVNVDDMLTGRPGGIVRVGTPQSPLQVPIAATMMPLVHPADGGAILQAVEYVDTIRENRTGVTKYNQGLDSDSLNKTAHGMQQVMNASQQRIELIARVLAETGVKCLMQLIHAMSKKHGRQAEMVKLRNKWVEVDPRSWLTRSDLTVSVGIGTGNKDQMLQHLMMILQAQKEAFPIGLATKQNLYNSLKKLTQNAGFKEPDQFWTNPEESQEMPQAPNPDVMKAQADVQKTQAQLQAEAMKQDKQLMFDASESEKNRQAEMEKVRIQEATKVMLARLNHEQSMIAATDQRQFEQDDRMRTEAVEQEKKASEQSEIAQVIAELQQVVDGLAESMSRPINIIRGPDGRAATLQ